MLQVQLPSGAPESDRLGPYEKVFKANIRPLQQCLQDKIIMDEEGLTEEGLAAPHFFMLQVVLKAKLTLSHLGQTQSPSDKPSGPANT